MRREEDPASVPTRCAACGREWVTTSGPWHVVFTDGEQPRATFYCHVCATGIEQAQVERRSEAG
jgi:hypothetical protein